MYIKCHNYDHFMDTIERLLHKGIRFESYTESFTIELTGGY